ncbi:MAG: histidine triad nucleotide-binding protein [Patescibacteria group bacterium]
MITDVFCKIIKGELPSEPVYRDDEIIVIKDIKPSAPVHLLVMPIRHLESLEEAKQADDSLLGKMLLVAHRVAKEANLDKGYRLVMNNGEHGGQLVPHLHLHVLGGKRLGAKLVQD